MDFTWLAQEANLSSAALTVRAQTISPNDQGTLLWDIFFPRANVDSVKLSEITTLNWRPTADRREWNAPGRLIPMLTPSTREMTMVPIEAYFQIAEEEMQKLVEANLNASQEQFRAIIRASLPDRVDDLVTANYRRVEVDAFHAWANGEVVQKNPQTGKLFTASYGFSADRYTTAGTAWDDGAVNAYDLLMAFLDDALDKIGGLSGVMLRRNVRSAIIADAPRVNTNIEPTATEVENRVADELGIPFRFYVNERSVDVFDDGGTAYTRTKLWPAGVIAAVPDGDAVGNTAFAPVVRAVDIDAQAPGAEVDVRGQTVWHETSNAGKRLEVQAQVNAFPVPDEQRLRVEDTGIA